MKNILSILDFIDNKHNIIFTLGNLLQANIAVYLIEEYIPNESTVIDNTTYIKMSRYPHISLSGNIVDSHLFQSFDIYTEAINKVLKRFANQLGLKNPTHFEEALKSLIITSKDLIKGNDVNLIIFNDFPHTPLEIVVFYLAKIMAVDTYFLFPIPRINIHEERFILTKDFNGLSENFWNEYESILNNSNYNMDNLPEDLQNYFKEYTGNIKTNKYYFGAKTPKLELIQRYISRLPINIKRYGLLDSFSRSFKRLKYIIPVHTFERYRVLKYYERLSEGISQSSEANYFYFPLHYQPEANTIPWGNKYSDQYLVIEQISKNLPKGYFLYVKEHPTYWTLNHIENFSLYRSRLFYKKIAALDNVKLISYKIPSHEIFENTVCVITITGTIAWESFFKGVPCIVLGDIYYKEFPTSITPEKFNNDMSKVVDYAINKGIKDYSNEFLSFLWALENTTVSTINPIAINHSWDSPYLMKEEEILYAKENKKKAEYIKTELSRF